MHERRTAFIAGRLRELLKEHPRPAWDYHDVKVALRDKLINEMKLREGIDYGQSAFDDAISIVNTATPFIRVVH